MSDLLLFEINTRCWLRSLSNPHGKPVTLAAVPDADLASWKKRGFTHIWLMGVWATGPKTRELACAQPSLRTASGQAFGLGGEERITSSPYAVADYTVDESFGGLVALRQFRARLHRHGLGLVLDFVPNHVGLDHRWLSEKNSLFVRHASAKAETFPVQHSGGTSWVAHGKDPFFPAWIDTAQLDYRLPGTRAAMLEALQFIAAECDGVRCDMAMLLLQEVFDKTWSHFPNPHASPQAEFWAEAISVVKLRQPGFLFVAEAYWDLEARLQGLGFDYIYDKRFYDYLTKRDYSALQRHLRAVPGKFHPVRFLENHDEPRIASIFTVPEQKAAAVFLLSQPGLRLLHDGQLAGARQRTPVQFAEYWPETVDLEIEGFYDHLLSLLAQTTIGRGQMSLYDTGLAHCFAIGWQGDSKQINLVLVNLAPVKAHFRLHMPSLGSEVKKPYSDPDSTWDIQDRCLDIRLAACGFELLEWSTS
jgi:hypothetical protein